MSKTFLDELKWRGLLHQTAGEGIEDFLQTPGRVAYAGFDPTSDSLTIGNFIPIKLLMHWQQHGHKPIVVMGGGTGLIGDPSGRDDERSLMTREQVEANVASQRRIMDRLLDFDARSTSGAILVNNIEWLNELGYIEVLRDIGKHFSVNMMIQKESVAARLQGREQGISYTEFSYMVLQAYDYLHLRRKMNCRAQLGGSDQFGNIVAGMDLIRREFGHEEGHAYGATAPLVSRSDGKKMSKSTGDAIWMSADTENATSPYQFYQYFINLPDADVEQWLEWYTMLDQEQIVAIVAEHDRSPHLRHAQRELARTMTTMAHGSDQLQRVESASEALFSGDVQSLDVEMLRDVFADVPGTTHDKAALEGDGVALIELLPQTSLAQSKREAREFLSNGAVTVNGEKVEIDSALSTKHLLHGSTILIRRGKKKWHATKWA